MNKGTGKREEMTVSELARRYLEGPGLKLKPKTQADNSSYVRRFVVLYQRQTRTPPRHQQRRGPQPQPQPRPRRLVNNRTSGPVPQIGNVI
jgi:hypothetical protein